MLISEELIRARLAPYGVRVTSDLASSISQYIALLSTWNKRIHLTSLIDTGEILERHFGESFLAVDSAGITNGRLADVGSGGGFPGIPLKLLSPNLQLTLIESNLKKCTFLSEVVRTLNLTGVEVLCERYDKVNFLNSSPEYITARALGRWDEFLDWSHQQLAAGGKLILWLGRDDADLLGRNRLWNWQKPILSPRSERRVLLIGIHP